ncbi:MAG: helix-turn-helix transcriptional regulator [Verrucomicrobiaceae bacterium]|nr:helix-turn-helix transcriptional regulator [Verrucomicrobiaceae bacterium]
MSAEAELVEKLFGRLVNQVRNEQRKSQEDFGGSVGVSRTEMHNVEGGGTDMKVSTFIFLCRAMHRGFGEVAAHLEHQMDHPEDRPPETPLKSQRGKNTRRASH